MIEQGVQSPVLEERDRVAERNLPLRRWRPEESQVRHDRAVAQRIGCEQELRTRRVSKYVIAVRVLRRHLDEKCTERVADVITLQSWRVRQPVEHRIGTIGIERHELVSIPRRCDSRIPRHTSHLDRRRREGELRTMITCPTEVRELRACITE